MKLQTTSHTKSAEWMKLLFEEISPISLSSLISSQLCRGCSFSKCIINYMQFYSYLLRVLVVIKMSRNYFQDCTTKSPWTKASHFLPTTRKITQFSEGKEPKPGDKIVYTAGAFDLFRILNIKNVYREDISPFCGVTDTPVLDMSTLVTSWLSQHGSRAILSTYTCVQALVEL